MLKILPRRPQPGTGTTDPADAASTTDRPLSRFIDGHAGGMPAPRRRAEPAADAVPGPISARHRPS